MKTTPLQFRNLAISLANHHGDGRAVAIDTIVIVNILADLNALQQYEAMNTVQFKVPVVKSYLGEAVTQATELLDLLKLCGDMLKPEGPE